MLKLLMTSPLLLFAGLLPAQTPDSTVFIIHRHLKVIGQETRKVIPSPDGTMQYSIDCSYSDRGTPVPLMTTITLSAAGEPLAFFSKGFTARRIDIHDSVVFHHDSMVAKSGSGFTSGLTLPDFFPVNAYAPATMQELLLRWWKNRGMPPVVNSLYAKLEIKPIGSETIQTEAGKKELIAIGIRNLIWGWEYVWIDRSGSLVAISTINGEGDKIEFVRSDYEEQLLFFAQRTAEYGVRQYRIGSVTSDPTAIRHGVVAPHLLVIRHGVLVDIRSGDRLEDAAIVITGTKITWTGPSAKVQIPRGAEIIDAKGMMMLPGLWDMHAHMKQSEWCPAYIAAGITTVRDMANEFVFINTLKSWIDQGEGTGPHILRAGIIDGPGPMGNGIMIAENPEQGIALVRKYKDAGFEQVKLYGQLQPDVVQAICNEAHRLGLTVAGHIPQSITTETAVDMGIDMISHMPYLLRAFKADSSFNVNMEEPVNRAMLTKLLQHQVVVDPTLTVFELIYRPKSSSVLSYEPAIQRLPASMQRDFANMGVADSVANLRLANQHGYRELLLQLYTAGVPIVAGTDMMVPGFSLYHELELYVRSGLTPLQALQCATLTPARVMGRSGNSGELIKGADADVILVDGDPLKDITAIRRIQMVFKDGVRYDPGKIYPAIGFKSDKLPR